MAGNDDGYIVFSIGIGYCPCSFWIAGFNSQLQVADRFCIRYCHQQAPGLLLKCSTTLIDGQFKNSSFAIKILYQLLNTLYDHWRQIFFSVIAFLCSIMKAHFADIIFGAWNFKQPQRRMIICSKGFSQFSSRLLPAYRVAIKLHHCFHHIPPIPGIRW